MASTRDLSKLPLRRATLILAGCVAAFVPVMQVVVDRAWPQWTKPCLAGIVVALVLAGLCLLPRRWNLKLFLMSVMGVLTVGVVELVCSLVMAPGSSSIYDWDPTTIYRTRANSRKTYRRTAINGGQSSEVSINSLGFRGPEIVFSGNHPRVMVYGDSFIEAEYSAFENTFCERLRQDAETRLGRSIEVINAGTNGFGPDQVLLRMESELPRLKPQLVVLSIFADNDYGDLLRNKLFRLNGDGKLVANAWTRAADCQHPGTRGRYEPALWKLTRNAIRGLQSRGGVVESYMERWRVQCQAEYDEYITRGDSNVHDQQADHYDADISLTPGVPSASYKARLFGRVLERIRDTCQKNQTQLLVMIIPSPADLIEGYDFCRIDPARYPKYQPRALSNVAVTAAGKHQVRFVNLYDPFSKADASKLFFRGGDNHWNDEGQRFAAGIVGQTVRKMLTSEVP